MNRSVCFVANSKYPPVQNKQT